MRRILEIYELLMAEARSNKKESEALKKVEAEELFQARQEEEAKKLVKEERIERERLKREEGCKRLLTDAEARELDLMRRFRHLLAEAGS